MITLDDVNSIQVLPSCMQGKPCSHVIRIKLKDGRSTTSLDSVQVWSLISSVADEKINPQEDWTSGEVKKHFKDYNAVFSKAGKQLQSPEVVLNTLFPEKKPLILSFDIKDILTEAEYFSGDEKLVLSYIRRVVNNAEFQADPEAYMNNWRNERGTSEECQFPEDDARQFFNLYFAPKENVSISVDSICNIF